MLAINNILILLFHMIFQLSYATIPQMQTKMPSVFMTVEFVAKKNATSQRLLDEDIL